MDKSHSVLCRSSAEKEGAVPLKRIWPSASMDSAPKSKSNEECSLYCDQNIDGLETKKIKIPSNTDVQKAEFESENMALYSVKLKLKKSVGDHCHLVSDLETGTGTAAIWTEEDLSNISDLDKVTNSNLHSGRKNAMTTSINDCPSKIETKNRGGDA